jgi:hypothetical protein
MRGPDGEDAVADDGMKGFKGMTGPDGGFGPVGPSGERGPSGVCIQTPEYAQWLAGITNWVTEFDAWALENNSPCADWLVESSETEAALNAAAEAATELFDEYMAALEQWRSEELFAIEATRLGNVAHMQDLQNTVDGQFEAMLLQLAGVAP